MGPRGSQADRAADDGARDLSPGDRGAGDHGAGSDDPFASPAAHSFTARIYYADTDFSGVVYYGRYLEFLERGRSDLLHRAGIRHRDLLDGTAEGTAEPLAWVVRRIAIDYRGSARIEDEITVRTALSEARGARLRMAQRVELAGRTIVEAAVEAALITLAGRPVRIPRFWIERLARQAE